MSLLKNNVLPMQPLTRLQSIIFQLGGLLLIAGAILPMVPSLQAYAPYVFTSGALMFATMQLQQRYEGRNLTIRRLRRQQIMSAFLLLLSACLMLVEWFNLGLRLGDAWKLLLCIAAVLQLYTAFRLPAELDKEADNQP